MKTQFALLRAAGRFAIIATLGLLSATQTFAQTLVNSSFEEPRLTAGVADFTLVDEASVPGWETTAGDNLIEIWSDSFQGVAAYEFDQHAELNATEVSALFQDLPGVPSGAVTSFEFAHRGRLGVDTLRLTITDLGSDGDAGGGDDTILFTKEYSTDNTAWAFYTSQGEAPIVALGNPIRFAFESVSSAGGNAGVGNFLDAVNFGVGVIESPVVGIPTLNEVGLGALALMLVLAGVYLQLRLR